MKAQLYAVPVGVMENQLLTTIEVSVPDLLMSVSPTGSSFYTQEEFEEKYSDLKMIKEFDIDPDDEIQYQELKSLLEQQKQYEEKILVKLEKTIKSAIHDFQEEPHIHIPTIDEMNEISGHSGLILEE